MTRDASPGTSGRVVGIGLAIGIMVVAILTLAPSLLRPGESASPRGAGGIDAGGDPIAAEADVFRIRPGDVAVAPAGARRENAHPRTLEMYRSIRAFPGAPPRIPHGLTAEEFRGTECNTCHQRGGWVARFSAYAPTTPHPEYAACLQCHLPDDALVGISLPDGSPDAVCLQCHVPGASAPEFVPLDWEPPAWPETEQRALPEAPHRIPHDFQLRGNCLACHMGPGAVEEIRTTHPERANCRQCHVPARTEERFTRPLDGSASAWGGGS